MVVTVNPERRGKRSQVKEVFFDSPEDITFARQAISTVTRWYRTQKYDAIRQLNADRYSRATAGMNQYAASFYQLAQEAEIEALSEAAARSDALAEKQMFRAQYNEGTLQLRGKEGVFAYEMVMLGIGLMATEASQTDEALAHIQYLSTQATPVNP